MGNDQITLSTTGDLGEKKTLDFTFLIQQWAQSLQVSWQQDK